MFLQLSKVIKKKVLNNNIKLAEVLHASFRLREVYVDELCPSFFSRLYTHFTIFSILILTFVLHYARAIYS